MVPVRHLVAPEYSPAEKKISRKSTDRLRKGRRVTNDPAETRKKRAGLCYDPEGPHHLVVFMIND
ncbi:MAG: hypothetical protein LUQ54_00270, partial [Methanoregula sp.]|nr:hypothetical protein [Methanoregula sp.]